MSIRAMCAASVLFGASCDEDGTPYGVNGGAARFSISASASAAGEQLVIAIAYRRVSGANVPMLRDSLSISSGAHQITIPIDLTACLLDATRVVPRENACSIVAALTLRSADRTTIDSSTVGPVAVAVGEIENLPATALRAIGMVAVTVANSLVIGDTTTALAVLRDRDLVVISGRPITWTSSNNAVATVSANGRVTAVNNGSATMTASSQGVSGSANITVAPAMTVISVSPAPLPATVSIETPVRLTFSENIDPLSVTPSSFRLTQNGVDVVATRSTTQNEVTLTPSVPLTEFNTPYVLTVNTSLRSDTGNHLSSDHTTSFTTMFWDANYAYRLTNELRPGESLDVLANTTTCFMVATSAASSQFWYFVPVSNSGFSTMANVVSGAIKGLEGAIAPSRCFMLGPPFTHGLFTGTQWRAVSAAPFSPGRYYMQNLNFNAGRSLDITPDSTGAFAPRMLPTGNITGQFWSFVRVLRM